MIERSVEGLLTRTAREIEYPPTPDLRGRVMASLQQPATRRVPVPRPALGFALLVSALVVVAGLAIGPSRDAIARLFGVEGSRIELLPTPLPGQTATPFPNTGSLGGVAVEPADLPARAGFEAAFPVAGSPRLGSRLLFYDGQPVAVHHFGEFDLWQTDLGMRPDAGFGKLVPDGGLVEEVEVGGATGVWVSGGQHFVYYYDASGQVYRDSQRVVDRSTLIWRTDAFFYRMETDLPLEEAVRIASTLP